MDPRLNPNSASSRPPQVMQDVTQPAPVHSQPQPSPPPAPTSPSVTPQAAPTPPPAPQLVDAIPLHQPGQQPAAGVPVMQMPDQSTEVQPEDDLERILQAVNNKVKAPGPLQTAAAPPKLRRKIAVPASLVKIFKKVRPKAGVGKPVGIIVVTLAVFLALTFTAIFAYRQGSKTKLTAQPGKVGTSYTASAAIQEAGGLLVRPSDLDDFSQALQSKMNSLNDSQDFNASPLSDQLLGL